MAGRTIILQCGGRKDEAPANAAGLQPGMLAELNAAGELIPHGTADGFGSPKIIIEDALRGRTVDTVYETAEEQVPFIHPHGEGKLNLLCKEGSNYPTGTKLASAGDGEFRAAGAGTKQVFATVRVGADLTGAGDATLLECDIN